MRAESNVRMYSLGEEIANSITHGVGIVLAIAGLGVLTAFASLLGNAWHIVSCSIFSATQILLYTASTLYHSIPYSRAKRVLRVIDHSAIFLLIAGTYTPFTLVSLRGVWGWLLFGIVWGIAVLGIVFQVALLKQKTIISVLLYVGMGWVVVMAINPLLENVAPQGLLLLLLGGLSYSGGVVFYMWHRLPYHHAVWHIFVLAGSIFHFFAILFYVIPLAFRLS